MPNPSALILPMEPQPLEGVQVEHDVDGTFWATTRRGTKELICPIQPGERLLMREEWGCHWGEPPLVSITGGRIPAVVRTCGGENIQQSLGGLANSSPDNPLSVYYRAVHDKIPTHIPWQPASTMPDWAVRRWLLIRTIEARRVDSLTDEECELTGLARHGAGWVWLLRGEVEVAIYGRNMQKQEK